jgi:hypothetical protein
LRFVALENVNEKYKRAKKKYERDTIKKLHDNQQQQKHKLKFRKSINAKHFYTFFRISLTFDENEKNNSRQN